MAESRENRQEVRKCMAADRMRRSSKERWISI
jgi:hypothetical protein